MIVAIFINDCHLRCLETDFSRIPFLIFNYLNYTEQKFSKKIVGLQGCCIYEQHDRLFVKLIGDT